MMRFEMNYSEDPFLREQLFVLFAEVFSIPPKLLRDFYQKGFWDPTYCPYTYFDGDRAVANASWFHLPLMVEGEIVQATGIQSVMTLPSYRGQGLMTHLLQRLLNDIDDRATLSFLCTEQPVLYEKFGFRIVQETQCYTLLPSVYVPTTSLCRRLDLEVPEDATLLKRRLERSAPISQVFAPVSYASSFHFNSYQPVWSRRLYYNSALDAVLIYETDEKTLWLYGVLSDAMPSLDRVLQAIGIPTVDKVVVDFNPDRFPESFWMPLPYQSPSYLMMRGTKRLSSLIKYPEMAKF